MGKKDTQFLIDGKITLVKLDQWFYSCTKKNKIAIVHSLSYDSKKWEWNDNVYGMYKKGMYNKVKDFTDNEVNKLWEESPSYINYANYIIYNKLPYIDENGKISKDALKNVETDDLFFFLDDEQIITLLNLDTRLGWKYIHLFGKFKELPVDEKNTLIEKYLG